MSAHRDEPSEDEERQETPVRDKSERARRGGRPQEPVERAVTVPPEKR